jgi:hypothetical protein
MKKILADVTEKLKKSLFQIRPKPATIGRIQHFPSGSVTEPRSTAVFFLKKMPHPTDLKG